MVSDAKLVLKIMVVVMFGTSLRECSESRMPMATERMTLAHIVTSWEFFFAEGSERGSQRVSCGD